MKSSLFASCTLPDGGLSGADAGFGNDLWWTRSVLPLHKTLEEGAITMDEPARREAQ